LTLAETPSILGLGGEFPSNTHQGVAPMAGNKLYYGDNLDILRRYVEDESLDLIYLDPPGIHKPQKLPFGDKVLIRKADTA
jgi:hypothetical protein